MIDVLMEPFLHDCVPMFLIYTGTSVFLFFWALFFGPKHDAVMVAFKILIWPLYVVWIIARHIIWPSVVLIFR